MALRTADATRTRPARFPTSRLKCLSYRRSSSAAYALRSGYGGMALRTSRLKPLHGSGRHPDHGPVEVRHQFKDGDAVVAVYVLLQHIAHGLGRALKVGKVHRLQQHDGLPLLKALVEFLVVADFA